MTLEKTGGTAINGNYSNVATADPDECPAANDTSMYYGVDPAISIKKVTVDGPSSGDGSNILTGEPIKWRYEVTGTWSGNMNQYFPGISLTVTDDKAGVTPTYVSGDTDNNGRLNGKWVAGTGFVTEVWIYEASGTSITGDYSNTGTASAVWTDSAGHPTTVTNTDTSSYFGADPQISIDKKTNGKDDGGLHPRGRRRDVDV